MSDLPAAESRRSDFFCLVDNELAYHDIADAITLLVGIADVSGDESRVNRLERARAGLGELRRVYYELFVRRGE